MRNQKLSNILAVAILLTGAVMSSWGDMNSSIAGVFIALFAVALFAMQLQ